jgi:hypothetical protein
LSQVDAAMPTVVLHATDAQGRDQPDVRVTVDGVHQVIHIDGRAMSIDPGAHVFQFESAGYAPVRQDLVVSEGEKDRQVRVQLVEPVTSGAAASHANASNTLATWAAVALGGVGVSALSVFAVLAANGQADYDRCIENGCTSSAADAVKSKRVLAWSLFGVGIGAAAASVVLLATGRRSGSGRQLRTATSLDLAVDPTGVSVGARASF